MKLTEKEIKQIDTAIERGKDMLASKMAAGVELKVGYGVLDDTREYQLRVVLECNEARWM